MKDKVLRLCKRLDKFTLDEIGTISELNSEVLLPLLEMYVKNKFGLHVPNLYIAQVKQAHGIIERENFNKGAEGHRIPQCPKEKWDAIEDALRYFRMI